jgi:hypothetical protein
MAEEQEQNLDQQFDALAGMTDMYDPAKIDMNINQNSVTPMFPSSLPNAYHNKAFDTQKNTGGLPPYYTPSDVKNNQTNTNLGGNWVESLANASADKINSLQNKRAYAPMYTFDSSPKGAFKDRYKAYGQDVYNRIGFNPLMDNEAWYNDNTTFGEDLARTMKAAALPMLGLGFMSPLNSYANMLSGNNPFDVSEEEASEYDYLNQLAYSSKGGVGGFTNNLLLSASYSAGILLEGATEGALIGGVVGAVSGEGIGAIPGAMAGGALGFGKNLLRLPQSIYQSTKAMGQMLKQIRTYSNLAKSRNLFRQAAGNFGKFINPLDNTIQGFKTSENLSNLARYSRTAGGLWNDVKNVNLALSEGRLEGGFTRQQTYDELYNEYYNKYGEVPSAELQEIFMQEAETAGWQNSLANTALVFYSNKIAFPSITRASFLRGVPRMSAGTTVVGRANRDYQVIFKPGEKLAESTYSLERIGFRNALKGFTKPKVWGNTAINYFKANLVEGLQESAQDVLNDATKDYYKTGIYDPSARNMRYALGTLSEAIGKQISAQGFETFASGFFMGTILQLPGKLVNGATMGYNRFFKNRGNWDTYIQNQERDAQSMVDALNTMTKDAKFFFDPRFSNYSTQMLVGKTVDDDTITDKDAQDAAFTGFMSAVTTSLSNNTFGLFLNNLKDYKQASPQDIEEAWDLEPGQGKMALDQLDENIKSAERIARRYKAAKGKMRNQIDMSKLKPGTEEYNKAEIYNAAYNLALQNFVFMEESFDDNLAKLNKLYQKMSDIGPLRNLNFSEISSIADPGKLNREIQMLETSIQSLRENPNLEYQGNINEDLEYQEARLNALRQFEQAQNNLLNVWVGKNVLKQLAAEIKANDSQITEEDAEMKVINELMDDYDNGKTNEFLEYKEAFKDLLLSLAPTQEEKAKIQTRLDEQDSIDALFNDLLNVHILKNENAALAKYVNLLANPADFFEHVENNFKWMKDLYNNRKEYFQEIVESNQSAIEKNALLNELADQGIFVDLEEFAEWVEDHDKLPSYFIDVTNNRIINDGSVLYEDYIQLFERAAQADEQRESKEKLTDKELFDERVNEINTERARAIKEEDDKLEELLKNNYNLSKEDIINNYNEVRQRIQEKQSSLDEKTQMLESVKQSIEQLASNDFIQIEAVYQNVVNDLKLLSEEQFQLSVERIVQLQDESLQKVRDTSKKIKADVDPAILEDTQIGAAFQKVILDAVLEDKVNDLNEEIAQLNQEVENIEELPDALEQLKEYKVYKENVDQINERYDELIEQLKEDYADNDREVAPQEDFFTTSTPFKNFPAEFQSRITELFDKFLVDELEESINIKTNDLDRYETLRAKWLETQPDLIDTFNEEKTEQDRIKAEELAKPPKLKFLPFEATGQTKTEDLGRIYDRLKNILAEGEYAPNAQKPNEKVQLTPEDIENINSDLEAIEGYLKAKAAAFQPRTLAEETVRRINDTIINRQGEVVEITDEDGNVTGRRFSDREETDPRPTRVTSVAEEIKSDLTNEPQMSYTPIEKTEDGQPGPLENLYNTIFQDERLPTLQSKVDKFLERFRELAYSNYKKSLGSESKVAVIENNFRRNPTFNTLERVVRRVAFKEYSDSGTNVDALTRLFLTPSVSQSGFIDFNYDSTVDIKGVPVQISTIMSKQAFDALFQPGSGIIAKLRQGIIDGQWQILSENVLLFDKRLKENGITGEIDLLAIDKEGKVKIIDIKTGKAGTWKIFGTGVKYDKEIYFRAQQSIYSDLFYNMSGIDVESIGLLPLELDVTIDGYINSIKRPAMMTDQEGNVIDTIEIEYLPEISEFGIERIDPQLKEIAGEKEEAVISEDTSIPRTELDKLSLQENIGKTVIYQNNLGTIVKDPETGNYFVEIKTRPNADLQIQLEYLQNELALENASEFKSPEVIVALQDKIKVLEEQQEGDQSEKLPILFNLEPVSDGSVNLTDIGIQPTTDVESIGQQRVVGEQIINAKFDNPQETIATINGVTYNVLRDNSGTITLLSYKQNDNRIKNLKYESTKLSNKIFNYRQALKAANTKADKDKITRRISKTQNEKQRVDDQINTLANNNPTVYLKGGNVNDYIFALNKLPNNIQKLTANRSAADEVRDLKEIGRLSINQTIADAIDSILAENYPETMDVLIEQGLDGVAYRDAQELIDWLKDSIQKLEALGFDFINRGDIVDDVQRQINALNLLLSDIELINLNKDGKISKKQRKEVRELFDPEKEVQARTSVPTDAESGRQETERILRPSTERELRELIKKQRTSVTEVLEEEVETTIDPLIEDIQNATSKTINEAYQKAYVEAIKEDTDLSLDAVNEAFEQRENELATSLQIKDLSKDDYLVDKEGTPFIVKKISDGTVTLKNMITKDSVKADQEELLNNYDRNTDSEPMVEENTTEDKEVAKENIADLKKLAEDNEALNKAKQDATEISREDLLKNLKDNSENC